MQEKTIEVITPPVFDISYYINETSNSLVSNWPEIFAGAKTVIGYIIALSIPLSVLLLILIIISVERLKHIRKKEALIYDLKIEPGFEDATSADTSLSNKWARVTTLIESQNDSDWRQAIMEADIMLGELLTKQGYQGDGIGEQLQRAVKSDFFTLDQAWEAHKVRNQIAHEGSNFALTQFDARRVINMYKQVFNEFYYI